MCTSCLRHGVVRVASLSASGDRTVAGEATVDDSLARAQGRPATHTGRARAAVRIHTFLYT